MAKSKERLQARQLRRQGFSVKTISRELKVARSSVSTWVRDICLTSEQLRLLNRNCNEGRNKGRTITSLKYQQRREHIRKEALLEAQTRMGRLSAREFIIAGIALYWAEGNKKTHAVRFTNSDPRLIVFALHWLRFCFNLPLDRFGAFVGINEAHKQREAEIIAYWSQVTAIPVEHFIKTIFKQSANKKFFENSDNYYGTLTIFLWKPANVYYKILGFIEALGQNNQLPV